MLGMFDWGGNHEPYMSLFFWLVVFYFQANFVVFVQNNFVILQFEIIQNIFDNFITYDNNKTKKSIKRVYNKRKHDIIYACFESNYFCMILSG